MIQIDNTEKANLPPPVVIAPPPPSYSQLSPPPSTTNERANNAQSASAASHPLMPSSMRGALNSPQMPTPTSGRSLHPGQIPSPLVSPNPTGPGQVAGPSVQQQQPRPMLPMDMEAQAGSLYQQQLFARCARGDHDVDTKYGPCGIITAVICFPFGLIALFIDREKKCARCGVKIYE